MAAGTGAIRWRDPVRESVRRAHHRRAADDNVGAPEGHSLFDEVETTVIATLELGPDAPPLG